MAKKKVGRRRYSKAEIEQARRDGNVSVIQELVSNLLNGTPMSIAETEAAVSIVGNSRPKGSISRVSLASIPAAQDSIFITLFLAYYGDLEGKYGIIKFSGYDGLIERIVSREEKKEDVIRLNEYYNAWKQKFVTNRHKDQILNLVINEVNNQDLNEIEKDLASGKISKEEYDYKKKGTILLSKYLYLRITRIFDELQANEIIINFNDQKIEITRWSMVHILNRHYAALAKQYDSAKSFHQDRSLTFFENPGELKFILEQIASHDKAKSIEIKRIHFKLNGIVYTVHTENKIKDNKVPFIQLQTFYPTEDKTELQEIRTFYEEFVVSPSLIGYKKRMEE